MDASQTRLVEAGALDSAYLLAAKGLEIPPEMVKRMGLVRWRDGRVMQGPEPVAVPLAVAPEPKSVPVVAPLEGIVHPAGAMPEPKKPEAKAPKKSKE